MVWLGRHNRYVTRSGSDGHRGDHDGPNNTVVECDTIAPPMGPENPYGNAFYVEERPLSTEREAQRNSDFSRMRYWKVINPAARNWVGTPTGYKLVRRCSLSRTRAARRADAAVSSSIRSG